MTTQILITNTFNKETCDLRGAILDEVAKATQADCERDIDKIIQSLAQTKFENIAKEYVADVKDRNRGRKVKNIFNIISISLACVAVICAIASVIFGMGLLSVGTLGIALVTGFVGVTSAFGQLDNGIYRFIDNKSKQNKKKTRLHKINKKVIVVKKLIDTRIKGLEQIQDKPTKQQYCASILKEIEKVNDFIRNIKIEIPEKIGTFSVIDASPLLQHVDPDIQVVMPEDCCED